MIMNTRENLLKTSQSKVAMYIHRDREKDREDKDMKTEKTQTEKKINSKT